MSKKMPVRFMETGDTHVAVNSFNAEELEFSKEREGEDAQVEAENGPTRKDLRNSSNRQSDNKDR
jgi:predicted aspartyl protease